MAFDKDTGLLDVEKVYPEEEIRSHSSVLTNLRLDRVFALIDFWKYTAWSNPVLDNIKNYFSALYTCYDVVFPVLNEEENMELKDLFNGFWTTFLSLTDEDKRNLQSSYKMLIFLDNVNREIRGGLQKRNYFFKLGTPDIKGIDRSYKVLKEGGGLFGYREKQVQRMVEEQHEPS